MALERRPVQSPDKPGYPNAREYASDRRAFLWLLGAGATVAIGAVVIEASGAGSHSGNSASSWRQLLPWLFARPKAQVLGGIRAPPPPPPPSPSPVGYTPNAPAQPQARLLGTVEAQVSPPIPPEAETNSGQADDEKL
jgi:hypothetical protein